MPTQTDSGSAEIGKKAGRDPIILAAAGSVFLAWFQYYVLGNKEHGLFIGLWPPTLLAFSTAIRVNAISRKAEGRTVSLMDWLTQER